MASLIFEGEFQDLSPAQIKFIQNVLEKRGYIDNKVVFEPVGKVGDNYVANVKRIIVVNENGDNFYMIAKIAPIFDKFREMMNTETFFNNEAIMYLEVFPKFEAVQKIAEVDTDDKLIYPECYGCLLEAPNEIILLQDLKLSDYVILDRFKSLTNETVKIVIKNIAILHSLSYALKKLEPDVYNTIKNKLVNVYMKDNKPEDDQFMAYVESSLLENMDDDVYKNRIRGAITSSVALGKKLYKRDINSKHSTIQQGDTWTNNLMFKLEDDTPKECIMIDYQVSREANPVCDILYMILNCTDYKTRVEHFYEWLDYYHEQLDRLLHYYGMKANFVYPKDQLDADIRRYSKVFFGVALLISNILLRKTDEAAVIKEAMDDNNFSKMIESMNVSSLSSETLELVNSRIKGLIDSGQELGLF